MTSERRISSINGFKELTIQSTINKSDVDDAESNPSSDPQVSTYITNRKSLKNLFNNRFTPKIIPGEINPIEQLVTEDDPLIRETLNAHQTMILKEIVTDTVHSGTCIFQTPSELSRTGKDGSTTRDVNTAVATARLTPSI